MRATAEYLDFREREPHLRPRGQMLPQRHAVRGGARVEDGHRGRDDSIAAQPASVGGSVELNHDAVDSSLVVGVEASQGGGDLSVDRRDGATDVEAPEGWTAVTQVQDLARAGGGPPRHGASAGPALQDHFRFDRGAAARVP